MEALDGIELPGNDKSKATEPKREQHQHAEGLGDDVRCQRPYRERRSHEKDRRLHRRQRRRAEQLACDDVHARDGRHEDALEKAFVAVLDDGDRREDRREQHDERQRARVEVFEVAVDERRRGRPERLAEAGTQQQPEDRRRPNRADHAAGLPEEPHHLALPESERGRRHSNRRPVKWTNTSSSVGRPKCTERISSGNASTRAATNVCAWSCSTRTSSSTTLAVA